MPRNTRPQNELNEAGPPLRVPLKSLPEGDGALQTTPGKSNTPAPSLTFEGVNNMCGCYPPDTNGDVGGTQYMQWVNLHFAIYDKNTGAQFQAPRPGNQLFTGVPVCGTENAGDPVTIYDQYAGRLVASQFGDSGASLLPVRRRLDLGRRNRDLVRVRSSTSTTPSSTTTRRWACGRPRTRT